MLPYNKKLVANARHLRKNMTWEEKHLWYDFLKRLPLTVKRQHNIEDFIVDFYIAEKKLVIEVDGVQHTWEENACEDARREAALAVWGIRVLHYSNYDIRRNFDAVAGDILAYLGLTYADLKAAKQ